MTQASTDGQAACRAAGGEREGEDDDETPLLQMNRASASASALAREQGSDEFLVDLATPDPTMTLQAVVFRKYLRFILHDPLSWLEVSAPSIGLSPQSLEPMVLGVNYDTRLMPAKWGDQFSQMFWPAGVGSASGQRCTAKAGGHCNPKGMDQSRCGVWTVGDETCVLHVAGAKKVWIRGSFGSTAYNKIAAVWVNSTSTAWTFVTDSAFPMAEAAEPNPYVPGNPSVFAPFQQASALQFGPTPSSAIPVFRVSKEMTSTMNGPDGIDSDGCTAGYLIADIMPSFAMFRMKLPQVFIAGEDVWPDAVFGQYQLRYWSLSAHIPPNFPELDKHWWTANVNMLNATKDAAGYAYVFFVPFAMAVELQEAQGLERWQAPTLTWGRYTGPVLFSGARVFMRYKDASPTWEGAVSNAPCYATQAESLPVGSGDYGSYTPEFYGCSYASVDAFVASSACGAVTKELWP